MKLIQKIASQLTTKQKEILVKRLEKQIEKEKEEKEEKEKQKKEKKEKK